MQTLKLTMCDDAPCFVRRYQVRLIDTDLTGFAHFSSYFKMMEETEYAFLRSRGLSVVMRDQRGVIGFPRLAANIDVVRPLRLDDLVEIHLFLAPTNGKQIDYQFKIQENGETSVSGRFAVALCRFPVADPPYAILIPGSIVNQLFSQNHS